MIDRRVLLGLTAALALPLPAFARAPASSEEQAYGGDPLQRLDVYPRDGLKGAPVLVFVHGGGWARGDKRATNALPGYAERHGFLLVSVNYRLTPRVDAGGCAQDVAAAVAWVREHAREHGGDPRRIVIAGHSAGAHLVALIAADPSYLAAHGLKPSDLAGVIPIDGAGYDAVRQMELHKARPQGLMPRWFAQAFGDRAEALSPTRQVRSGVAYPPFLIFHVAARVNAERESHALAQALIAAGGRAEVVSAPDDNHATINRDFGKAGDAEGERAAPFIRTGRL
ncbi:MAG: alpha/beta hydrolase [Caulobacter sp.]|nr:alpha/beta hydrolase [Caulobacter sp.]